MVFGLPVVKITQTWHNTGSGSVGFSVCGGNDDLAMWNTFFIKINALKTEVTHWLEYQSRSL